MDTKEKTRETKKKSFADLGFSHMETAELVNFLNRLLSNYQVHYQKLRNFHWNVKGGDFFDIHEKFEEMYTEAITHIDDIAERIRIFGQHPKSTLKEYLEESEIKEAPHDLSSYEMVQEIRSDLQKLLSFMMDALSAANDIGDAGTHNMLNTMIKSAEKWHWMWTAFASK